MIGGGLIAALLTVMIRLYQLTLSPIVGGACRFEPSCSAYALEAIERHGAASGMRLTIARLLRCHPFARAGYDPVPEAEDGNDRHPDRSRSVYRLSAERGGRGDGR